MTALTPALCEAMSRRCVSCRALKKEYPQIKALAQKEKAEIYFGDAAHIRSDHHAGRTWGRRGETPVVQATGARYGMRWGNGPRPGK